MSRQNKNPFIAALLGLLLVPGSICLQAWNEYRTFHRSRGLDEAAAIVETIPDPFALQPQLSGKLVHLSGDAVTDEVLRDPKFGIEKCGLALRRRVEMYQWDEDEKTRDGRTTYDYKRVWREGRINSDRFEKRGHANPSPAFDHWEEIATQVLVGRYELSDALKRQKTDTTSVPFEMEAVRNALGQPHAERTIASGDYLYYSASKGSPEAPQIGDLKIRFQFVPTGPVSLIARLDGSTLSSYRTNNGELIERLNPGTITATQLITHLRQENTILAWVLRGVGFLLCLVGITMIFAPAQSLFRWIPLVGDITGGLIFIVGLLVSGTLSLVTISISWIAVRPLLTTGLLIVAAGLLYLLRKTVLRIHPSQMETSSSDEPIMVTDDMLLSSTEDRP